MIGCSSEPQLDTAAGATPKLASPEPAAANSEDESKSAGDGHRRLVEQLAELATRARYLNTYFGDRQLRELRKQLADPRVENDLAKKIGLLHFMSIHELRLGQESEAIEHGQTCYKLLQPIKEKADPNIVNRIAYWIGVSYLRLGETQNCCRRNTPDSCVLPIQGEGIHQDQRGSRNAIKYFSEVLANTDPGSDLFARAKWLLNISYMTIGGYPEDVPDAYRISPAAFSSEIVFPRFKNVAQELGLATFSESGGVVVDDFDNDNYLDVLVSTYNPSGQIRYFHNNGESGSGFTDQTIEAGLKGILGGLNLVQGDYDNDGRVDVLVLRGAWFAEEGQHPNSLLRNVSTSGSPKFVDVTFEAGLAENNYPTQTASWGDYDNDGDLDIFIGNESSESMTAPCQLFQNNGDGTFTDVAALAGVTNLRYAKSVVWGDFDNDRWLDLYVSNYHADNRLYRNQGNGEFVDVAQQAGVTEPEISFPAWFWDVDNDGDLDILATAYSATAADVSRAAVGNPFHAATPKLYQNNGNGQFTDVAREWNLDGPYAPMGSNFGDLDGDGFLDFYLGTGWPGYDEVMPNVMFYNEDGERFRDVTIAGGFGHLQKGHGVAFVDLDNDGDQDLFQQMGGAYPGDKYHDALYENPGFGNHWISLHLVGEQSNRSAIGARIRIDLGGEKPRSIFKYVNSGGTFGCNPLRQNVGLGGATVIEQIQVFWPTSQQTQKFQNVAADQFLRIIEGQREYEVLTVKEKTFRNKAKAEPGL
ncbi:CRTAC1 family protein [Pirellulales bacterium]|nr:CRTAC1 family protein [Pirellulales bacterium]